MNKIFDEFTDLPISAVQKWKLRHPEELKERRKIERDRHYAKLKKDKVRWARVLERSRIWKASHKEHSLAIQRKAYKKWYAYNSKLATYKDKIRSKDALRRLRIKDAEEMAFIRSLRR